jgi:tetratricopeptide (TPR) repeat protein
MLSDEKSKVTPQQRIDSAEMCNAVFNDAIQAENTIEAMEAAEKQISISQRIQYSKGIADGYANKGYASYLRAMYPESLTELMKAQSEYELMNNDSGKSICLERISVAYIAQRNYDLAIESVEEALALNETRKDADAVSRNLNNLGQINMYTGNYTSAKAFFAERVGMERSNGDSVKVARALQDIGIAYTESGDAEQGLDFHRQAINALSTVNVNSDPKLLRLLINIKLSMAGEHFLQNDYAEAVRAGEDGLRLSQQADEKDLIAYAYRRLAEIYGLMGREDIQLQYLESSRLISDTLRNIEFSENLSQLEAKYASVKMEAELKMQEAEVEKQKLQRNNDLLFIAVIVSGFLAVLFLVALIIIAVTNSRRRRNNVY